MNPSVEAFIRTELRHNLALCYEPQQLIFKRMYSSEDLDKDIMVVVDDIPTNKLDWALTQVQRTVVKNRAKQVGG